MTIRNSCPNIPIIIVTKYNLHSTTVGLVFVLQEPLNSGDDVSEEDPADLFETDNVVVCQYDKV